MKSICKKLSLFLIILGIFSIINISLAATTCEQKYLNAFAKCATDCTDLGTEYKADTSPGLCESTAPLCCFKTGGSAEPGTGNSLLQNIALQVPIFDVATVNDLPTYIGTLYRYLVIILVPLAIVMIIVGGVSWILAAGDQGKITNAKKYITSAFSGLIIGLFSYVLLSLVGIETLNMPGIQIIDPARGETLIINDQVYSVEEGMSKLPPERQGSVKAFDRTPCPRGQNSFQVFFTNYYTPEYGDKGSYMPSFFCNIAMQCSCPKGINRGASCGLKNFSGGYHPCNSFPQGTAYCNHTASGPAPIGNHTIAASKCFKFGCKFTIQGSSNTYEVMDRGSAIKGTHMDLYVGTGRQNLNSIAGVYTINLINPESCFR